MLAETLKAVGEGGGGGLVDDALDREAGELAGGFGGGALGVVEISGDGDDGAGDVCIEDFRGALPEAGEDEGGDLLGGVLGVADGNADGGDGVAGELVGGVACVLADAAAHEALD